MAVIYEGKSFMEQAPCGPRKMKCTTLACFGYVRKKH